MNGARAASLGDWIPVRTKAFSDEVAVTSCRIGDVDAKYGRARVKTGTKEENALPVRGSLRHTLNAVRL